MPNTVNFQNTVIETCDSNTAPAGLVAATGNAPPGYTVALSAPNNIAVNTDVTQREGTGCIGFNWTSAGNNGGVKLRNDLTGGDIFDLREWEVSAWFLNPKTDGGELELLGSNDYSIALRVYSSGGNYADYYQTQNDLGDGTKAGGWQLLRCSGGAGTEDGNSGTWTNTDAANIVNIGIVVESLQANSANDEVDFCVDYIKRYQALAFEGLDSSNPWTMTRAFELSDGGATKEGRVTKFEDYFRVYGGITFGETIGTAGEFEASNEYIFLDHSSSDVKYDVDVLDNFTVTLGVKNAQVDDTYAQDGVQFVATENGFFAESTPVKCAPPFTVETGGLFDAYATLMQGFGTMNFGDTSTEIDDIELIGCDLYDNDDVQFRSTGLEIDNTRIHQDSTDVSGLGSIFSVPTQFDRIQVFNGTDGLVFRVTMTAIEYNAGDLTDQIVVLDGQAVTLRNSVFDPTSIKRVV